MAETKSASDAEKEQSAAGDDSFKMKNVASKLMTYATTSKQLRLTPLRQCTNTGLRKTSEQTLLSKTSHAVIVLPSRAETIISRSFVEVGTFEPMSPWYQQGPSIPALTET